MIVPVAAMVVTLALGLLNSRNGNRSTFVNEAKSMIDWQRARAEDAEADRDYWKGRAEACEQRNR